MEDLGCPVVRTPLSNRADEIQRKGQTNTVGVRLAAGVAGRYCVARTSRLRGSTPDYLLGFTPLAFVISMTPQGSEVFWQSFLLCMRQVAQGYMVTCGKSKNGPDLTCNAICTASVLVRMKSSGEILPHSCSENVASCSIPNFRATIARKTIVELLLYFSYLHFTSWLTYTPYIFYFKSLLYLSNFVNFSAKMCQPK